MPEKTANELLNALSAIDHQVEKDGFIENGKEHNYVIHIGKRKDEFHKFANKKGYLSNFCRDHKLRESSKNMFYVMFNIMLKRCKLAEQGLVDPKHAINRVRGIDACSNEIGTRPEVFSQLYRALKGSYIVCESIKTRDIKLGYTYHVGEDFLDPIDGLRACEEAVEFLDLANGDRIGHGTVLGISLEEWYMKKSWEVYLPKQNLLDNLVWLLDTVDKRNISIPSSFKEDSLQIIHELYSQLYGDLLNNQFDMYSYRASMHLRGDRPYLYIDENISNLLRKDDLFEWSQFDRLNSDKYPLERYRTDENIKCLVNTYHFNKESKLKGEVGYVFSISKSWLKTLFEVQTSTRNIFSDKAITIETNPTSNVLINNFDEYEKHPIFNMSNRLLHGSNNKDCFVSINTDDQGVFDTTMIHQYNLLYEAMMESTEYGKSFDQTDMLRWFENIRVHGLNSRF